MAPATIWLTLLSQGSTAPLNPRSLNIIQETYVLRDWFPIKCLCRIDGNFLASIREHFLFPLKFSWNVFNYETICINKWFVWLSALRTIYDQSCIPSSKLPKSHRLFIYIPILCNEIFPSQTNINHALYSVIIYLYLLPSRGWRQSYSLCRVEFRSQDTVWISDDLKMQKVGSLDMKLLLLLAWR